ncbi:MAG: DnaD domain protein [Selenomonadaceae bacterium]|nr:DnaD domain protein [Selenomonadaceae bacterium]
MIIRIEKTKNYTVMANYHLRDKRLSFKAKGLMSFMLSLPDNWVYSIKGLSYFATDGKDAVRGALKELEKAGYLQMKRERNENGTLSNAAYTLAEKPMSDFPTLDYPTLEKPTLDNPTLLNTNRQNTKEENKDNSRSSCSTRTYDDDNDDDFLKIKDFYSSNIGELEPYTEKKLNELVKCYSSLWVIEGMKRCVEGGERKKNLRYLQAVLGGWKADGYEKPWEQKSVGVSDGRKEHDYV